MYIICTYLTSYLSHLAQGTDLTEIARLGPKVSEEWAATHPLHSNCSTILTIKGRYIGVISLDNFYGKCRQIYHTWILWVLLMTEIRRSPVEGKVVSPMIYKVLVYIPGGDRRI